MAKTLSHDVVILGAGLAGLRAAVELGAAHGALALTTPGDTSMVTGAEVAKLAGGGGARVDR